MEHNTVSSEVTFHHSVSDQEFRRRVIRTTVLLSVLTVIELIIGLVIYNMHKGEAPNHTVILLFKGVVCILTLAKAFYIVSVFMHLGDEIRNMIMTIVVPLLLFVWFIGAFLWDGSSFRNLRNTYDPYKKEQKPVQQPVHEGEGTHKLD